MRSIAQAARVLERASAAERALAWFHNLGPAPGPIGIDRMVAMVELPVGGSAEGGHEARAYLIAELQAMLPEVLIRARRRAEDDFAAALLIAAAGEKGS